MKRILVVNPFGIGDVIFTMTLVEAVRTNWPDAGIGFLCNERTEALVRMNSSVQQVFVFNRDFFRDCWRRSPFIFFKELKALLEAIKKEHFDTLLDLSLGREYSFFAMLIGIKRRVGFDFKGRGVFLTHKKKLAGYSDRPVADMQLELLDLLMQRRLVPAGTQPPLQFPLLRSPRFNVRDAARSEAALFLENHGILRGDKILAVAPGGGRSWGKEARFKQWDAERFAEVVNAFGAARGQKALLLGDESEGDLLRRTAALIKVPVTLAAGEPIERVCALLQRSESLLCNDGGLLHLANALGVKTVSLFGPVDEKVYGPYGDQTPHAVLTQPVPCRPCYKNFHFPPCPYDRRCLEELPMQKVVAALEGIT